MACSRRASLLLSGLATWTAAQNPDLARAFTSLAFASGAFGFAVPLALLIAVVARTERKWLAVTGYVIAALAGLSAFGMLTDVLYPLIPVGRFGGLIWLVLATLPEAAATNLKPCHAQAWTRTRTKSPPCSTVSRTGTTGRTRS